MIQAFSAVSTRKDAFDAGNEAALAAVTKLSISPNMLWVFGAINYDQQKLLDGIVAAVPDVPLVGCTTDGEISNRGEVIEFDIPVMRLLELKLGFPELFILYFQLDTSNLQLMDKLLHICGYLLEPSRRFGQDPLRPFPKIDKFFFV
ncbi:MAG: FIST N-terminal domain-containing protein [Deltaproteobacteria bacterium]